MQENFPHNLSVAIYARVSTDEQKEGQTIDSQVAELVRHAQSKSWTVVDTYKDEGWSGSLLARPQLDRLRDEGAAGRFAKVLVNDVDRLARDVTHLGIIKRDLEKNGVELIFRKLPPEKSPTYNLMINILGSFAEFEREMILDRTRRGRRHHIEVRQKILTSHASFGYRYVTKDQSPTKEGFLEVIPEEAAVVKQIYDWIDKEGLSLHKVLKRLNDINVRPRKSSRWSKSSLAKIVHNETYTGVWHYNKHYSCEPFRRVTHDRYHHPKSSSRIRPRNEWWPVILDPSLILVERAQWERVQRQIRANRSLSPRNSKRFYLLKGLLKCGCCSSAFVGDAWKGRPYYRCVSRCKKVPSIRSTHLETNVWNAVEEVILDPKIILPQASEMQKRFAERARNGPIEMLTLKRSVAKLQKEEERILEAYRAGFLTPIQMGDQLQKLQARKSSLEIRLKDTEHSKRTSEFSRYSVEDFCKKAASQMKTFTDEEKQRFLNLIIQRIVINDGAVRIVGIIPANYDQDQSRTGQISNPQSLRSIQSGEINKSNQIASTTKWQGVSSADEIESTMVNQRGDNIALSKSTMAGQRGSNTGIIESTMAVDSGTKSALDHEKFIDSIKSNGFEFNFEKAIITLPCISQPKGVDGKFISR
jgi:site-specific DNA recombinase